MATTGAIPGNLCLLYTGGTPVAVGCLRDTTLDVSRTTIDATCKDNDGAEDFLLGGLSWSISGGGLLAFDATNGNDELMDALLNKTELQVMISTEVTGDTKYSGTAIVESVSNNHNYNDVSQWSFTLKGKGTLSKTAVS